MSKADQTQTVAAGTDVIFKWWGESTMCGCCQTKPRTMLVTSLKGNSWRPQVWMNTRTKPRPRGLSISPVRSRSTANMPTKSWRSLSLRIKLRPQQPLRRQLPQLPVGCTWQTSLDHHIDVVQYILILWRAEHYINYMHPIRIQYIHYVTLFRYRGIYEASSL